MQFDRESEEVFQEAESLLHAVPLSKMMTRVPEQCPSSLYEYVLSQRSGELRPQSISTNSTDSIESISTTPSVSTTHSEETEEQRNNKQLLDRLFSSLFKTAKQKLQGKGNRKNNRVEVDERTEKNMSRVSDWKPLLHLFDPKSFYAARQSSDHYELPPEMRRSGVAANPKEARRMLGGELLIEKLAGGNSNHVYRIAHPLFENHPILLRVYGSGDDEAIDRYRDVMAMKQMSDAELSPSVLHTFKWGRVEEFMDQVATCTTDMLLCSPVLLRDIFKVVQRMHQLTYAPFLPENVNRKRYNIMYEPSSPEVEGVRDPNEYYRKYVQEVKDSLQHAGKDHSYYVDNIDEKVMEILCPTSFERVSFRYLRLASANMKPEYRDAIVVYFTHKLMEVREYFQEREVPMVFSHNDLNPGNVLLSWRVVPQRFRDPAHLNASSDMIYEQAITSEDTSPLQRKYKTKFGDAVNLVDAKGLIFIDFEYSDANYRGYDLGNILCEMDVDYMKGNGEGEPGFVKTLYHSPAPEFKEAWRDLPEEYPRFPTYIYETWKRRNEPKEEEPQQKQENESELLQIHEEKKCTMAEIALTAVEEYFTPEGAPTRTEITKEHLAEVFLGMLASHIYWSLWSFVLACNPDEYTNNNPGEEGEETFAKGSSGLDYMHYGNLRLKEFMALQKWLKENDFIA